MWLTAILHCTYVVVTEKEKYIYIHKRGNEWSKVVDDGKYKKNRYVKELSIWKIKKKTFSSTLISALRSFFFKKEIEGFLFPFFILYRLNRYFLFFRGRVTKLTSMIAMGKNIEKGTWIKFIDL